LTFLHALPEPLITALALLMVSAVVALVAWALQLMQAANDRQEFSLMLAGCMVCSAAVGLATVMVLTLTGPGAPRCQAAAPRRRRDGFRHQPRCDRAPLGRDDLLRASPHSREAR
jgi:hypothetical protein